MSQPVNEPLPSLAIAVVLFLVQTVYVSALFDFFQDARVNEILRLRITIFRNRNRIQGCLYPLQIGKGVCSQATGESIIYASRDLWIIDAFITEAGVLRPPFGPSIAAALLHADRSADHLAADPTLDEGGDE